MHKLALTFSILLFLYAQATVADIYVKLYPKAEYSGEILRLRDVAVIRHVGARLSQKEVGDIQLENFLEEENHRVTLKKVDVLRHLEERLGNEEVFISGLERVDIAHIKQHVSGERIAAKAVSYLKQKLSDQQLELELRLLGDVSSIGLTDVEDVHLNARSVNLDVSKRMCVFVDILQKGTVKTILPVWIEVKAMGEARALIRDVSRGELYRASDVERIRVDLASNPAAIVVSEESDSMMFSGDFKKGALLKRRMLAPKAEVVSGENVWVVARLGDIEVQGRAKAMNDGYLGERVELLSISSNERFKGRVIGEGKVLVDD